MAEQRETPTNPEILKGKNILVVDDEETILSLTQRVFQRKGAIVQTAINGEVAIALIKERTPDLVITDNDMPEMTGLQLIKELRASPDTAKLPIIFTSGGDLFVGLTLQQTQEKAVSLGADAGLAKPYTDIFASAKLAERLLSERQP